MTLQEKRTQIYRLRVGHSYRKTNAPVNLYSDLVLFTVFLFFVCEKFFRKNNRA